MIVIGVALLGKLVLQNVGPGGTAFVVYAAAFGLLGGGIFLEKREKFRLLGRVGIGGGWALLFFATYAIHHVAAMRILDSLVMDCVLMLAVAMAMTAHTLRYRSQLVTGFAFLLGYTTIALSFSEVRALGAGAAADSTVYGLFAGVILAAALVTIILKMGWFELEIFGILSSYLNHFYWLYKLMGIEGAHGRAFPEYHASLAILLFYWVAFRVSYVLRNIKTDFDERVSAVAALLNTLLLLGVMKFQSVQPDLAYIALLLIGAVEFTIGQLPVLKKRRLAFVLLSVMGAALMIAAVPSHFSGDPIAYLWLVGAEVFLIAGVQFEEVVFRRVGLLLGLMVGIDLFGFNFRTLADFRMHSEAVVLKSGLLFGVCAAVFYLNAIYLQKRWEKSFTGTFERRLLNVQSYLGAAAAVTAAWALFSNDWTAVAFAAIMFGLAWANQRLGSRDVEIQYALLGVLTLYRAIVFNFHIEDALRTHIATRLETLPLLAALFYGTAKFAGAREDEGQRVFRALFSFAGSALIGLLIWYEAPEMWIAALFLAAGAALALLGRRWNVLHLGYQEHVFAAAAIWRTLEYNTQIGGHYGPFSVRMLTVTLVAAGLYAISRRATLEDATHWRATAYLHTTAATSLLALLMWYEASTGWLMAFWAVFALALTLVDRRFEMEDLRWQAHALAGLALLRGVTVNMYVTTEWHGVSVRLLTVALTAVIFYGMSRLIRMPEELRKRDFHHVYSWAGSVLVGLLMWHELKPLSIAVGWAVLGLVLFEYGLLRKTGQFRYQAYVALSAAFARIFFANLTASEAGEFWGPRLYTVLPLALICFFVYAQLPESEESAASDRRWHFDALVAYLGTGSVMALFYYQFAPEWVVASYAAVAFVLFGAAWGLQRDVFLQQGILATLGTFARGMLHNLFGASFFLGSTWKGPYFVVSVAIAILFATLFFAYRLRDNFRKGVARGTGSGRIAELLRGHPEQLQFFAPIVLLTVMLALKTSAGLLTFSWGVEGALIVLFALVVRERSFLHAGFGLLVLCIGKVLAMDMWRLDLAHKVIAFIGVGVAVAAVSFLYIKFQDKLRQAA